jgi:hypothetical protein
MTANKWYTSSGVSQLLGGSSLWPLESQTRAEETHKMRRAGKDMEHEKSRQRYGT